VDNSAFSVPARRASTSLWRFCAPSLSAVALLGVAFSRPALAAETRYFAHADQRYLEAEQRKGGAAFIPSKVPRRRAVPLVVFLHGTNPRGRLHPWLGGSGDDLRLVAEALVQKGEVAPFVLAGPSQTRDAKAPAALWQDFDLKRFVRDVQSALRGRAEIDERWVALFGWRCSVTAAPAAIQTAVSRVDSVS
jgi:hypothetical protein